MNRYLYILSEGERDELFYERLAERVTGMTFEQPTDLRLRHGANWKTAMAGARLLMNRIKHWKEPQAVSVIIAVDNDRAPKHPASPTYERMLSNVDQNKAPRHQSLVQIVESALGPDRAKWPVDVALAVPVEMIESWVLLLLDPNRPSLPIFAQAVQKTARDYYSGHPPPQLKDLCESARVPDESLADLFWRAAEQDLEAAAMASLSLKMFIDELKQWSLKASTSEP